MNVIDLAEKEGFDYVETASDSTGYPSNLMYAITGFDNFEQAERMAKEYRLNIISIAKKDGWSLWYRGGTMNGPIEISSEDYGDDFSEIRPCKSYEFFDNAVKGELKQLLDDDAISSLDDLEDYMRKKIAIQSEMASLEDDEILIIHGGVIYEKVKRKTMRCHIDSITTQIALIDYGNK